VFEVVRWVCCRMQGLQPSPNGASLSQPSVERREKNERRATLGGEDD